MTPEQQLHAAQLRFDAEEDPRYWEKPPCASGEHLEGKIAGECEDCGSSLISHKPLASQFTKIGFSYTQIVRNGDLAIYRQFKHVEMFETVVISRHNGYEVAGSKIEPAETYPSSEQWGTKGWTYSTLEHAKEKLAALIAARDNLTKKHT